MLFSEGMRRSPDRGHIDAGIPLLILAVLVVLGLSTAWSSMPLWARVAGVALAALLAVGGLLGLRGPSGLGENALGQGLLDPEEGERSSDRKS